MASDLFLARISGSDEASHVQERVRAAFAAA